MDRDRRSHVLTLLNRPWRQEMVRIHGNAAAAADCISSQCMGIFDESQKSKLGSMGGDRDEQDIDS